MQWVIESPQIVVAAKFETVAAQVAAHCVTLSNPRWFGLTVPLLVAHQVTKTPARLMEKADILLLTKPAIGRGIKSLEDYWKKAALEWCKVAAKRNIMPRTMYTTSGFVSYPPFFLDLLGLKLMIIVMDSIF